MKKGLTDVVERCIIFLTKMTTKLKYKTRYSSVQNIRKMFANTSEDSISLRDVFIAWGRNLEKEVENRAWLSNKLTHLKYHDLITPVYSYEGGPRKLQRLELTIEGKRELGRIKGKVNSNDEVSTTISNSGAVSLSDLTKLIAQFREDNKDNYDINFDVKLKEN